MLKRTIERLPLKARVAIRNSLRRAAPRRTTATKESLKFVHETDNQGQSTGGCTLAWSIIILEIGHFEGLGGPGEPGNPLEAWGAKVSKAPGAAQTPKSPIAGHFKKLEFPVKVQPRTRVLGKAGRSPHHGCVGALFNSSAR